TAPEEVFIAEPNISTPNVPVSTASAKVSTVSLEVKIAAEKENKVATRARKTWDNIQAQIEADEELAQKLQAEERGKFFEVERARLLVEMIDERKRLFAQQRAKQKRNKPTTQAQQRTYMYFVPMESDRLVPKILTGSSKRTAEIELEHEGSKRQKTNEEQSAEEEMELSKEELQN
ncbi:hypothetical protein Tco_0653266, partial [Tanacetum coccineum]